MTRIEALSVLKMDFVKLRMYSSESYMKNLSLIQVFQNIRDLKKKIKKEIDYIFDITYNNIFDVDEMTNYDFFLELYEFLFQLDIDDLSPTSIMELCPVVSTNNNSNKRIYIHYTSFYNYYIDFYINNFIHITSNMYDIKDSIQFCDSTLLSFDNKVIVMNVMRSIHTFLYEYIKCTSLSNMDIIQQYKKIQKDKNKPFLQHLFRK